MSTPLFEIIVQEGGAELARHTLGPGEHFAGTAAGCAIPIPHGAAERKFARISIGQNGRVVVEDLESASGTLLDDLPIVVAGWAPGHVVRFGDVRLELWPVADERAAVEAKAPALSPEDTSAISTEEVAEEPIPPPATAPAPAAAATPYTPAHTSRAEVLAVKKTATRGRAGFLAAAVCVLALISVSAFFLAAQRRPAARPASASAEAQTSFLQALQHIDHGAFAQALPAIDTAIAAQPGVANYYFIKGNILESLSRFGDARDAYGLALQRDAGHGQARENRELCEEILKTDGPSLSAPSRAKLVALMRSERRDSEAKALEAR